MFKKRAKRKLIHYFKEIYNILNIPYKEPLTVILEIDKLLIFHEEKELEFKFNN